MLKINFFALTFGDEIPCVERKLTLMQSFMLNVNLRTLMQLALNSFMIRMAISDDARYRVLARLPGNTPRTTTTRATLTALVGLAGTTEVRLLRIHGEVVEDGLHAHGRRHVGDY